MTGPPSSPAPRLARPLLRELYSRLQDAGYIAKLDRLRVAPSQETIHPDTALHLFIRLFVHGESLDHHEVARALTPLDPHQLVEAGLLIKNNDQTRALFQIQVYDDLLFLADFMPRDHPADLVLPIGPSGKYLASVTIRAPVESALDLGCGCGIQALLMARHARHVTATDINPRALALTRLNADLNGFSNITVIEGSYFEPVRGRAFDLITANLPYVLSPENKYVYRDQGWDGGSQIRETVTQIPLHLNEGGYAHIMLNWIHQANQPWWQPIEEWAKQRNVDALTLYSNSVTPEEYSRTWILINEVDAPDEYRRKKDIWLQWFESQEIERIASGLLTFRRRTSRNNWRFSLRVERIANEPLGKYILHLFQNQDFLAQIKHPHSLLDIKVRAWNMKVETSSMGKLTARTTRGFLIRSTIHPMTVAAINHLNGKTSLRDAIQKSAGKQDDPDQALDVISKQIYDLMNLGMIEVLK